MVVTDKAELSLKVENIIFNIACFEIISEYLDFNDLLSSVLVSSKGIQSFSSSSLLPQYFRIFML